MLDGARQLRADGRDDEAAAVVEEAYDRFADDPLAHLARANLGRRRDEEEAVVRAYIEDALALGPSDPDTHMGAAALLMALHDVDEAHAVMERVAHVEATRFMEPHLAASLRALLALLQGDAAAAEPALREAMALEPRKAVLAQLLAETLLLAERPEDALAVVRDALARYPSDTDLGALLDRIADEITGGPASPTRPERGGASTATAGQAPQASPWRRPLPNGNVLIVHGRHADGKWRVSLEDEDGGAWGRTLGDAVAELLELDAGEPWPDWLEALVAELDR
jgi:tetratricopeptide (TPR) repeat protein